MDKRAGNPRIKPQASDEVLVEAEYEVLSRVLLQMPPSRGVRGLSSAKRAISSLRMNTTPGCFWVWVMNSSSAFDRPRALEELAHHECLLFKPGKVVREWQFEGAEGSRSVKVQGRFVANNHLVLRQAALLGRGIANLPRYLVLEELRSGALVSLLAEHPVTQRHIYLVYPHRQLTPPKVRAFADFLARYFQRLLG